MNKHNDNNNCNAFLKKFLRSTVARESMKEELTEQVWLLSSAVSRRIWNHDWPLTNLWECGSQNILPVVIDDSVSYTYSVNPCHASQSGGFSQTSRLMTCAWFYCWGPELPWLDAKQEMPMWSAPPDSQGLPWAETYHTWPYVSLLERGYQCSLRREMTHKPEPGLSGHQRCKPLSCCFCSVSLL